MLQTFSVFLKLYAKSTISFDILIFDMLLSHIYLQDISNFQKRIVRAIFFIKKFNSVSKFSLNTRSFQFLNYTFQQFSLSYSKEQEMVAIIMLSI